MTYIFARASNAKAVARRRILLMGGAGPGSYSRQGGVSRTRSTRQLTPMITREKKRLCVLVFCTPRLDAGRAV
jgi:hypothetical protein